MFVYQVLFWLGTIGFAAMVAMGFIHTGGHHGDGHGHLDAHGHALGNGGHGHAHGHGSVDSVGQHHAPIGSHVKTLPMGAKGSHQPAQHSGFGRLAKFGKLKSIFFLSPIDIFSIALGAGATGMLCKEFNPAILPWLAALGGIVLNYGAVRPIFAAAFRFASKPSEGLEGTIAHTGEAIMRFDQNGRGLVRLIVDGEAKQFLAILDQEEVAAGVSVGKGDQLLVLDVDPIRNTCRVTRV